MNSLAHDAMHLPWKAGEWIAIVISDAPCQGKVFTAKTVMTISVTTSTRQKSLGSPNEFNTDSNRSHHVPWVRTSFVSNLWFVY